MTARLTLAVPRALTPTLLTHYQPPTGHSWIHRPARPTLHPFPSSRAREGFLRLSTRTGETRSPLPSPQRASLRPPTSTLTARRSARARRAMKSKRRGSPAKAGATDAGRLGLERSRMGRAVRLALRRRGSWTLKFWRAALESRGRTLTFKLCGERSRSELSLLPQLVRLCRTFRVYIVSKTRNLSSMLCGIQAGLGN
jgi:hypothetical protein